ncbi:MAG: hypothetical protein WBO16_03480 [Gammaproteobacteria bacterium]|jgi:hypothetical protein
MKQESIDYLEKVACIAHANVAYHQMKPAAERNNDEAGAALLMSAYLEMYEHWQNAKPGTEAPSRRVSTVAATCEQMRSQLQILDRDQWPNETEGLFQMMTAFMFLFKHMYVPVY